MHEHTGRIDLCYFGHIGRWDDQNPYYWYGQPSSPEILFRIANSKPYGLTITDIAGSIGSRPEDIQEQLSAMTGLGMLSEKDGGYSICFSVILERDIPIIRDLAVSVAHRLARVLLDHEEDLRALAAGIGSSKQFGTARILYHTIGCDTLDGAALDDLADMGIMATSHPRPGGRDYILQGFEHSDEVSGLSGNLLCSCNRAGTQQMQFISFGDSNGERKDFFRFLRLKDQRGPAEACRQLKLSHNPIMEKPEELILRSCADVILRAAQPEASTDALSSEERNAADFLQELDYITISSTGAIRLRVPFFRTQDRDVINGITERAMELVKPLLAVELTGLSDKLAGLTSLLHGVDEREMANELWHQVFGRMNEELVNEGLLAKPEYIPGEGRYFRALYAGGI